MIDTTTTCRVEIIQKRYRYGQRPLPPPPPLDSLPSLFSSLNNKQSTEHTVLGIFDQKKITKS